MKEALGYVKEGHVVAVFPAGEVSTYQYGIKSYH